MSQCSHIRLLTVDNCVLLSCLCSLYQDGSGRQCLLIERVTKSDAGWYTLSAINEAGLSTCNARLDISCKSVELSSSLSSYQRSPQEGATIKPQMEDALHLTPDCTRFSSLKGIKTKHGMTPSNRDPIEHMSLLLWIVKRPHVGHIRKR